MKVKPIGLAGSPPAGEEWGTAVSITRSESRLEAITSCCLKVNLKKGEEQIEQELSYHRCVDCKSTSILCRLESRPGYSVGVFSCNGVGKVKLLVNGQIKKHFAQNIVLRSKDRKMFSHTCKYMWTTQQKLYFLEDPSFRIVEFAWTDIDQADLSKGIQWPALTGVLYNSLIEDAVFDAKNGSLLLTDKGHLISESNSQAPRSSSLPAKLAEVWRALIKTGSNRYLVAGASPVYDSQVVVLTDRDSRLIDKASFPITASSDSQSNTSINERLLVVRNKIGCKLIMAVGRFTAVSFFAVSSKKIKPILVDFKGEKGQIGAILRSQNKILVSFECNVLQLQLTFH